MTTSQELCQEFQKHLESYFATSLEKHGFTFIKCDCVHGGRECVALYASQNQQIVFNFSDGAFTVWFGSQSAQFPGQGGLESDGSTGWYLLVVLVEFKTGKRVYTKKFVRQVWNGQIDQYQFEADLFAKWADVFLPMFAAGQEETWRDAFHDDYHDKQSKLRRRLKWLGR